MKSTGMVRKIDSLGRIVLPIELRRVLEINEDASLEIYVDGDQDRAEEISAGLRVLRRSKKRDPI